MNDDKNGLTRIIAVTVITVVVVLAIAGLLYYDESKKSKPVVMTHQEAANPETVEKKVHVTPTESRIITREIERSADTPPTVTYYVQAPTVQKAAEDTAKQLKSKDKSLPVKALEKSDRTIVTPDEQLNKVDVYKINLRKAHKLKAGVSYIYDKSYFTAGYQAGRWEGLAYFDWQGKPKGGSVLYTAAEW